MKHSACRSAPARAGTTLAVARGMAAEDDDDWALVKQTSSSSLAASSLVSSAATMAYSTVTFAVQQSSSLEVLEALLLAVSTPSSPKYGQHLSFREVGALVANPKATAAVLQWIHASIPDAIAVNATAFGEYITVCSSVESLGLLLNASLLPYARPSRPKEVIWRSGEYSLPGDVSPHIEAVFDLVDKPPRLRGGPVLVPQSSPAAANISSFASSTIMTPARLRFLYNMGSHTGSTHATQAVFGTIGQAFAPEDIALFQSSFQLASNPVTSLRNFRAHNQSYCASSDVCGEASLDLEYMMAVAPRSPTTYWYASSFAPMSPFVDWIVNVSASARPPLVHSIRFVHLPLAFLFFTSRPLISLRHTPLSLTRHLLFSLHLSSQHISTTSSSAPPHTSTPPHTPTPNTPSHSPHSPRPATAAASASSLPPFGAPLTRRQPSWACAASESWWPLGTTAPARVETRARHAGTTQSGPPAAPSSLRWAPPWAAWAQTGRSERAPPRRAASSRLAAAFRPSRRAQRTRRPQWRATAKPSRRGATRR